MSLLDVYNQISSHDAELLEKQAAAIKQAEEEDAAGRIMARGFADELNKLAQNEFPFKAKALPTPGGTVKSQGFAPTPKSMTGGPMKGSLGARPSLKGPGAPGGPGGGGRFTGGNLSMSTGQLAGKKKSGGPRGMGAAGPVR